MQLERLIAALAPEAVLGEQSRRGAGARLRRPCRHARRGLLLRPRRARRRPRLRRRGGRRAAPSRSSSSARSRSTCRSSSSVDARARCRSPRTSSSASRPASSRSRASPARTARRRPRSCSTRCSSAAGRRPGCSGPSRGRVGGDAAVRSCARRPRRSTSSARSGRCSTPATAACALEASSHAAVLHRLDRVRFDALVFTNLTQDHLDFHGTMDEYFEAKRRLFARSGAAAGRGERRRRVGRAARRRARGRGRAPLITFGFADDAEIRPDGRRRSTPRAPASAPAGSRSRRACAAASTSRTCSAPSPPASCSASTRTRSPPGSSALDGVPGRFEAVDEGQPFAVLVDYAHTPDSLDNVLRAAREFAQRPRARRVRRRRRPRSRQAAADGRRSRVELADLVVVTSDNPRSEDPLAIIEDILQGAGANVEIDPDRRTAIGRAIEPRRAGRRRRDRGQGARAGPGGRRREAARSTTASSPARRCDA